MLNAIEAAEAAGIREFRLYRLVRSGYLEPVTIGPSRVAFNDVHVEIARIAASLLDRGVPSYATHEVSRRLGRYADAETLRAHARQIQVAHDGTLWSVFDGALNAAAGENLKALVEAGVVDRVEPALLD